MKSLLLILSAVAVTLATNGTDVKGPKAITCDAPFEMIYMDPENLNPTCIYLDYLTPACTWLEAKYKCENLYGGFLAEPKGHMHYVVYNLIQAKGITEKSFWIGGSDQIIEGTWYWVRDNSLMPLAYSAPHWYPCSSGLSNNAQPDGGTSENYACIHSPDFYYHSCGNSDQIYAFCQRLNH